MSIPPSPPASYRRAATPPLPPPAPPGSQPGCARLHRVATGRRCRPRRPRSLLRSLLRTWHAHGESVAGRSVSGEKASAGAEAVRDRCGVRARLLRARGGCARRRAGRGRGGRTSGSPLQSRRSTRRRGASIWAAGLCPPPDPCRIQLSRPSAVAAAQSTSTLAIELDRQVEPAAGNHNALSRGHKAHWCARPRDLQPAGTGAGNPPSLGGRYPLSNSPLPPPLRAKSDQPH